MHQEHDHDHAGNGSGGPVASDAAPMGHNHAPAPRAVAQWQTPHRPQSAATRGEGAPNEPDLDLVATAFVEGFLTAPDPTSFLRLAQVPFEAKADDGTRLVLLRVEVEAIADIGAVSPHLGGASFRYDPLPARLVSQRKRLRFVYFDGTGNRALDFTAATTLSGI